MQSPRGFAKLGCIGLSEYWKKIPIPALSYPVGFPISFRDFFAKTKFTVCIRNDATTYLLTYRIPCAHLLEFQKLFDMDH